MTKKEINEENICHWQECLTQFSTAEDLFNHVCSTHIGRKSAGTLSLECKWTGCQARASKRDHLTSHCRVHIALKPHVCSVCTKAFKRPQDLKKHEKIHTEEHHANHRQAKAIIVPSKATNSTTKPSRSPQPPPTFGADPSQQDSKSQIPAQQQQQTPYPFSFPTLGYPHHFIPQFPSAIPQQQGGGGGMPHQSVDQLAQFIALQQQLNSQAQAAASQGFSIPGMTGVLPAGYPIQLGQNPYGVAAAPGISFLPQGVYHYGFSAPGQPQPQYVQVPLQQQQPLPPQHRNSSVTSLTSTPSQSSLYPTLSANLFPNSASVPPVVKTEDQPSPAHSYKSQYSSISSPSGVPALSPPSLSTPENSYSPTPELDSDSNSGRRPYSGANQVAGKKRGFDEAAEHFLGDLKNKRFQSQDTLYDQLDALSTFLQSPEMTGPPALTPGRTTDDSSSSNGSDNGLQESSFGAEEVDTINQLFLEINQDLNKNPHPLQHPSSQESDPYMFSHHPEQAHSFTPLAPIQQNNSSSSLYPTLPSLSKNPSTHQYSYSPAYPTLPAGGGGGGNGQDSSSLYANLRLSKPPTAPSIAGDYRQTQYQHVPRLQRAAPSVDQQEAMEVDAEMAEAASALLMGKSLSAPASSSSRPKLPPLSTAIYEGPRLAPIAGSSDSNPPTLPHIRDVVSLTPPRRGSFSTDILESPVSSTTATFASPPPVASTSRSMYPSLSSTPTSTSSSSSRPVSAGGVERLTHRVHKMRLPSTSSETSNDPSVPTESGSIIDTTEELSASSDEDDEDHPNSRFKKSRRIMESPISSVKEEEEFDQLGSDVEAEEEDVKPFIAREEVSEQERRAVEEQRKINEKRKATIAYLVGYINAKYRESLAKRSVKDLRKAILKPSISTATTSIDSSSHKIEA